MSEELMFHDPEKPTTPANPAQVVSDEMVEAATEAYVASRHGSTSIYTKEENIRTERHHIRAALTAAIGAGGQAVASVVPEGCTGSALAFDPGVLHVNKDGSGYIAVDEDEWQLEDDRCEGPDGPEGSVHWITRLDASEMQALRDFLNGAPRTHPAPSWQAVAVKAVEPRKTFPILSSGGQKIDWQLVADHGEQAQKNHYQTVERLAQRGGLSWCELHAVLHNSPYQKMDTNDAIVACRELEARYLSALSQPHPADERVVEAQWREIETDHLLKGRRRSPAYFPATGEVCEVSGPNCDDANGYTWATTTALWQNDIFVLYGQPGFWPVLHKHEHVLFRPLSAKEGR